MADRPALAELLDHDRFRERHLGLDADDRGQMLVTVGADTMGDLLDRVVPEQIRVHELLELPAARSEEEMLAELRALAAHNVVATSMIGMGYADTFTPLVIQRNVL
jgi:glycine dehydrogenase